MTVNSEDDGEVDAVRLLDGDTGMHNCSYPRNSSFESGHQKQFSDPNHDNGNDKDEQACGSGTENDSDADADADEDDNDPLPSPPPLSQHAFAPPFYGRPPTPLPPSPSLTSLLRPSRPTTPDASEDEGGGGHPGDPLPRARPKVPTYEYYGFVLYLFSSLSFLIYLLWSYLPSPFLHALGIYYYPNRWWSLAIPSFLVMLLVYIYVALAGYNVEILTLPLNSVETVVDEAAQVAVVDERGRIIRSGRVERDRDGKNQGKTRRKGGLRSAGGADGLDLDLNWREVWNEGTDAVMDVPLAGVCEVLYGEGRDWDSELEDVDVVITKV